jgi:probable phosphoglycerate mutase
MDTIRSIYIVRHGETEENKQKIVQGQLDTPLNSEGEKQADLVGSALKHVPFDTCYSSDLVRAADTAKRILVHHPGVGVQTQIALRERVRVSGQRSTCFVVLTGRSSIWASFRVTHGV